ncbi:hypothetical protein ACH4GK_22530 [Streptomyces rimosus]|uniref:hypothetical protein n=1 Tax=Streptomyces rimosus TaxID=1927 RepID=UPI0004CA9315|nr:hypothetical protein [Streptomyces rimosus]
MTTTHAHQGPYAAYAFDFDGTLADTAEVNHGSVRASLAAHGIHVTRAWLAAAPAFTAPRLRRRLKLPPDALPDTATSKPPEPTGSRTPTKIRPITTSTKTAHTAAEHTLLTVVTANYGDIVRHGLSLIGF